MGKIILKREKWKNRFVWTVRQNGKLLARRNASGSGLTKQKAASIFKSNNTLNPLVFKTKLTNVVEIRDLRKKPRIPSKVKKIQTVSSIFTGISGAKPVHARSMSVIRSTPKKSLFNQSDENAFMRLSNSAGGAYDAGEGKELFNALGATLKRGIIYYQKK